MKSIKALIVLAVMSLGVATAYALSPFQTVAGVGGPMPSTSLSCTTVGVSSFSATVVATANSNRESLWVQNISSAATTGLAVPAQVVLGMSSISNLNGAPGFNNLAGIYLSPHNTSGTTFTDTNSSFWMNGGSIFQGTVYAVAQGTGAFVSACEFNP